MFKSQKRPMVVPQAEHARFAGILASLWGNADFDRPALDFQSFIKGVTFHDRGYGQLDYYPLGEVDRETWLSIQRRGILLRADDAISNVVSLMHIKRLVQNSGTAQATDDLVALADEQIAESVGKSGLAREVFEWADKITQWCDDVAFDFSFEAHVHQSPQVYARTGSHELVTVDFDLRPDGIIAVRPWPFLVEWYAGFIIGYEIEGYPDRLEPVLMPFRLTPWVE